jgi:predicted NAD-dependent protein-ADP-ribosyltransferase YbiA (DUF1768 family)
MRFAAEELRRGRNRLLQAESAPHDYVWGIGHDMSGSNLLGEMLVRLREDLLQEAREAEGAEAEAAKGD